MTDETEDIQAMLNDVRAHMTEVRRRVYRPHDVAVYRLLEARHEYLTLRLAMIRGYILHDPTAVTYG